MHHNPNGCTDKQQDACNRLNKEPRQALLDGAAITHEIQDAAADPDHSERRGNGIIEIDCTKPKRYEIRRHPFERVDVCAEDAFELRIAGRG